MNKKEVIIMQDVNIGKKISSRFGRITESELTRWDAHIGGLMAANPRILPFHVGQPDFSLPRAFKTGSCEALEGDNGRYTGVAGSVECRSAIARYFYSVYGYRYAPDEIIVMNGGKEAIFFALAALINKGDEIIVNAPYWGTYVDMISYLEGKAVIVDAKEDYALDLGAIRRAVTEKTKLIILNNPNNPTGHVCSRGELEGLAEIVIEYDLMVVSDEVYDRVLTDELPLSIAQMEGMRYRTIIANSFSKCAAMTGVRAGFVCADREIVEAIRNAKSIMNGNVNSLTQSALTVMLDDRQAELEAYIESNNAEYRSREECIRALLDRNSIKYAGHGKGFYFFIRIPCDMRSKEFALLLLSELDIAVTPGIFFGKRYDDHFRISFATAMEKIEEAIGRIEAYKK